MPLDKNNHEVFALLRDWLSRKIAPFSMNVFVADIVGIVKFSHDSRGVVRGFTSDFVSLTMC